MNNIVFLDIDGVLNSYFITENGNILLNYGLEDMENGFYNNQPIRYFNKLCVEHGFDVVITSTWRKYYMLEDITKTLYNAGLDDSVNIIGATPVIFNGYRCDEINAWLKENNFTGNFLILDDDSDMGIYAENLVNCDFEIGFSLKDFYAANKKIHNWGVFSNVAEKT